MRSKKKVLRKSGWNWNAFFKSVFWYYKKGMTGKAVFMTLIIIATFFVGLIPVMIYCGANGNKDFYNFVMKNQIII
ncbi:hypothetical protein [Anaerobranca gottschalkii]|uniref:Uncharacterized protein n=1 Tax=Anaerobranca gottschalkii DSM 13577 TaxID=1120990 RepID=A0A1I0BQP6_9FIRM|nr:hypothetical protein [Anaerobranca gottschalkii]SET09016.1 hypothetical protein SAMN03080614_10463 [Anaerobranca gottschalkii DSM 13577]